MEEGTRNEVARNEGRYGNWGRFPNPPQRAVRLNWPDDELPKGKILAFGNGRSQGDVCLNSQGVLVDMRGLNRLVKFDRSKGLLTAEAGITLDEILRVVVPTGWMLPVVPGTRFVTLGGAIANDVHGKNHHRAGSFGHHVTALTLRRSDGTVKVCKAGDAWFAATVGGLGLTGIIAQATVQLMPVLSGLMQRRIVPLRGLEDFFSTMEGPAQGWDYSVAWLDMTAPEKELGRGYLELARWDEMGGPLNPPPPVRLQVPVRLPFSAVNALTTRVFNELWLRRPRAAYAQVDYSSFFWPLDGVGHWTNLYGPVPFVQCQVVVPQAGAPRLVAQILRLARAGGEPSFLNTLKMMGGMAPAGMLSFPREGVALALDFPYKGERTLAMLRAIEDVAMANGGAIYPAKDACMRPESFAQAYPAWKDFLKYKDDNMTSDFWQRVMGGKA
ncbi:MAG: FAD-binding protein [Proteobacteria bacterium]|nr:FAD-binding protein [Pseudomonadota bacterium]